MDRSLVLAAAGTVLFYVVLARAGIGCPIRFLSGISCAGCGMSRAWLSLLRGDFAAAAFYHPLFWLPPLAVLVWLLRGLLFRSWRTVLRFLKK